MTDTKIIQKILRTLTDKYTYIVVSIEESNDIETMTIDELQGSLTMHEKKFKRFVKENDEQVLKVEGSFRNLNVRGRGNGNFRGNTSYRGRGRGATGKSSRKATIECFKCHNLGLYQYECPKWSKEVNYANVEDEDDMLLMAEVDDYPAQEKRNMWFMDFGCSNHMCNSESLFASLNKDFSHSVKLGNDSKLEVKGKGIVKIVVNGITYAVGEVYFVPDLKNNLLSVGQLQEKGLSVVFKNDKCCLYHPKRGLIMQSTMRSN
ncbi:hypothetical protein LIER_33276 [Lithospermum erythrorhizon]